MQGLKFCFSEQVENSASDYPQNSSDNSELSSGDDPQLSSGDDPQLNSGDDSDYEPPTPELIALIFYCGLVKVSSFNCYWSIKSLYHGLWARSIMSRDSFKALIGMLNVVDPGTEDEQDKLWKVNGFLQFLKKKCKSLYQPF